MSNLPKSIVKNKLISIFLGLTIAIASSNIIHAKTANSLLTENSNTLILSQSVGKINFGADYYNALAEADRFYQKGDLSQSQQIQQRVKPDFAPAAPTPPPISDLSQLDAKAREYWNTATQAIEADPPEEEEITNKIFIPLQNLVKEYPAFVPGHILLADTHDLYAEEKEALATIEKAAQLYPDNKEIIDTQIDLLLLYN